MANNVTREQVEAAKRIDLLSYLREREPDELVRYASYEWRTRTHDSLVISRGLWFWHREGFGGRSALDYLIKVRGMSFVDAVQTLCRDAPFITPRSPPPLPTKREPKRLQLPPRVYLAANVNAYLQERGIAADIVGRCLNDGSVYEARFNGQSVCVFVGFDGGGAPKFGAMRGITSDLKRDCSGSDKRFGFCLPPAGNDCRNLVATESPIDALSHATLFRIVDAYRLSLGGTSPLSLTSFLERHAEVERVSLCLDADDAGQLGAERIISQLRASVTLDPVPRIGSEFR